MFTGIIEEIGTVVSITIGANSAKLKIQGNVIFEDLKIGDSVAVNGVCLTASEISKNTFTADVMHETLNRSSLGELKNGGNVNLERAMSANGRFGGHIVSGHIDGVGIIESMHKDDNAVIVTISADKKLLYYIVEKGSIAIDGISLTVTQVNERNFSVSVIPHTADETILLRKNAGDVVNLETDVIGKYIERFVNVPKQEEQKSNITMEFLRDNGF